MEIDSLDRALIRELQDDARQSLQCAELGPDPVVLAYPGLPWAGRSVLAALWSIRRSVS